MSEEGRADPAEIQAALDILRVVVLDPSCMRRLHPIEVMMVRDVLDNNSHLNCAGCVSWMRRLAEKALGGPTR